MNIEPRAELKKVTCQAKLLQAVIDFQRRREIVEENIRTFNSPFGFFKAEYQHRLIIIDMAITRLWNKYLQTKTAQP